MPGRRQPEQASQPSRVEVPGDEPRQVSRVRLPRGARPPFRVFVNGVEQREGADYTVERGSLRFSRPLAKEGKLGLWRWALMFFGIAGTYRKHDSVDVQYTIDGRTLLASGLEVEAGGASRGSPNRRAR